MSLHGITMYEKWLYVDGKIFCVSKKDKNDKCCTFRLAVRYVKDDKGVQIRYFGYKVPIGVVRKGLILYKRGNGIYE